MANSAASDLLKKIRASAAGPESSDDPHTQPTVVESPAPARPAANNYQTAQPNGEGIDSYARKYLTKEDEKTTTTLRMYKWRRDQLLKEVHDTGLDIWQIVDISLELYFRQKNSRGDK